MKRLGLSVPLLKVLGYLLIFVILHFLYNWFPSPLTAVFSGLDESFIQHAKVGFFAYSLVNIFEFILSRQKGKPALHFWEVRLLSTTLLPWWMFLLWFSYPTFGGRFPAVWIDILYANLVNGILAVGLVLFEKQLEKQEFSSLLRVWVVLFYLLSLALLVQFTFHLPWADFFRES